MYDWMTEALTLPEPAVLSQEKLLLKMSSNTKHRDWVFLKPILAGIAGIQS